ncbi:hypothetical protein NOVO_02860 [Rickettsiales bacterium Ac37b]|nr:hypothetical protein NOVO_02860 [Rickettsiales bacterium Ac37b]
MLVEGKNTEQTFKNNIPFSTKQMTTAFRVIGAISAGIVGFSFGPGAIFMVPFLAATGFVMSETLATKLAEKLRNNQDNLSKSNKISSVAGAILGLAVALTTPTVGIPVALAAMFGGAYV